MFKNLFKRQPLIIHLLHIGKTGGTSLNKMLEDFSNSKYTIKIHPHEFSLKDVPEGEKAIFFLRNPLHRFVSGFYSRKRKGQPTYNVPWNEEESVAFEAFETPNQLATSLSSNDSLECIKAEKAMRGIRHVNTHFRDWLLDIDYLKVHQKKIFFIGFQENFTDDVKLLHKKLSGKEWVSEVIKSHQSSIVEDKSLSEIAMENLSKWYKNDFELYHFCESLAQEVN